MARYHSQAPEGVGHVNVTPLIDVVMCLIIFFLVCGTLAGALREKVKLPGASKGAEVLDQEGRLIVNVVRDAGGGLPTVKIGGQAVAYEQLGKRLRQEKYDRPDLRVVLRASSDLPYVHISPVLVKCAEAKIGSIDFATEMVR